MNNHLPQHKEHQMVQEERFIDDSNKPIIIRFTGDIDEMYDFLGAYIDFRRERIKRQKQDDRDQDCMCAADTESGGDDSEDG